MGASRIVSGGWGEGRLWWGRSGGNGARGECTGEAGRRGSGLSGGSGAGGGGAGASWAYAGEEGGKVGRAEGAEEEEEEEEEGGGEGGGGRRGGGGGMMGLQDEDYSDNEDVGNAYGDMEAGMFTPPELLGVDGADAMLEEARMLNPHRQRHSTKPRSVAERKRREKISVRLQQLKDAMPKAEGRLDTASMIEDAVAYIHSLRQRCRALEKHNVQLLAKVGGGGEVN
ncbi:unnamed protein product [Closterium sp. Yama58-4]|nr:unnamed protein product [Closterium sp. Yama58-4]